MARHSVLVWACAWGAAGLLHGQTPHTPLQPAERTFTPDRVRAALGFKMAPAPPSKMAGPLADLAKQALRNPALRDALLDAAKKLQANPGELPKPPEQLARDLAKEIAKDPKAVEELRKLLSKQPPQDQGDGLPNPRPQPPERVGKAPKELPNRNPPPPGDVPPPPRPNDFGDDPGPPAGQRPRPEDPPPPWPPRPAPGPRERDLAEQLERQPAVREAVEGIRQAKGLTPDQAAGRFREEVRQDPQLRQQLEQALRQLPFDTRRQLESLGEQSQTGRGELRPRDPVDRQAKGLAELGERLANADAAAAADTERTLTSLLESFDKSSLAKELAQAGGANPNGAGGNPGGIGNEPPDLGNGGGNRPGERPADNPAQAPGNAGVPRPAEEPPTPAPRSPWLNDPPPAPTPPAVPAPPAFSPPPGADAAAGLAANAMGLGEWTARMGQKLAARIPAPTFGMPQVGGDPFSALATSVPSPAALLGALPVLAMLAAAGFGVWLLTRVRLAVVEQAAVRAARRPPEVGDLPPREQAQRLFEHAAWRALGDAAAPQHHLKVAPDIAPDAAAELAALYEAARYAPPDHPFAGEDAERVRRLVAESATA